jgi:hypothetical protein
VNGYKLQHGVSKRKHGQDQHRPGPMIKHAKDLLVQLWKVGVDTLFSLVGSHKVPAPKPPAPGLKYSLSHLALHLNDGVQAFVECLIVPAKRRVRIVHS